VILVQYLLRDQIEKKMEQKKVLRVKEKWSSSLYISILY